MKYQISVILINKKKIENETEREQSVRRSK